MKEQEQEMFGNKIFFLYPPAVFVGEIIEPLAALEYEVYFLSDINKARTALRQYKNSICFINIDTALTEAGWKDFVSSLRKNPSTNTLLIGIFSSTSTEESKESLLEIFKPECGLFSTRTTGNTTLNKLVQVLEQHNVKGRRKYVRAYCQSDTFARLNFPYMGEHIVMRIRDISSVGVCCFTTKPLPDLIQKNSIIRDAQLSLRGTLINCNLIVFATGYENQTTTYVLLFTKEFENASRFKVRSYIRQFLQGQIETLK